MIVPMLESVFEGFNATIFAYGQSGSGKTHTVTGRLGDPELEGITPRAFRWVFAQIEKEKEAEPTSTFLVQVQYLELYNGKARDLLTDNPATLTVKENKDKTFFVQDLSCLEAQNADQCNTIMTDGTNRRQVAETNLNDVSSRSHSIFSVLLKKAFENKETGGMNVITSKINLVDLAGSERQAKTGAAGDRLTEGANINLSLTSLGTVIDAIVKGSAHVPFRSSPLTMLLKDSLGGNCKTLMFANMGPASNNVHETISTLRFADRAKQIKNKPKLQMDPKDQKIMELSDLVQELRQRLKQWESGDAESMEEQMEKLKQQVDELQGQVGAHKAESDRLILELEKVEGSGGKKAKDLEDQLKHSEERVSQLEAENLLLQKQLDDTQGSGLHGIVVSFLKQMSAAALCGDKGLENPQVENNQLQAHFDDISGNVSGGRVGDAVQLARQRAEFNMQEASKGHRAEMNELRDANSELEKALKQALDRMETLKAKVAKQKQQLENSETRHNNYEQHMQRSGSTVTSKVDGSGAKKRPKFVEKEVEEQVQVEEEVEVEDEHGNTVKQVVTKTVTQMVKKRVKAPPAKDDENANDAESAAEDAEEAAGAGVDGAGKKKKKGGQLTLKLKAQLAEAQANQESLQGEISALREIYTQSTTDWAHQREEADAEQEKMRADLFAAQEAQQAAEV